MRKVDRKIFFVFAIFLGLIQACSGNFKQSSPVPSVLAPSSQVATKTSQPQGNMSDIWKIEFTLSGGFGGLERTLNLSNTGQMTVTDQRRKKQVTIQLSEEDLGKIASLMTEVAQLPPPGQLPACADCYQYKIDAQMDTQNFSFQVNDVNLAESGLTPLVKALMDLQERAISGQLK